MSLTPILQGGHSFPVTVASKDWSIAHNMGCRPLVQAMVWDAGSLYVILPKDIEYVDDNNLTVHFSTAYTGEVRLV